MNCNSYRVFYACRARVFLSENRIRISIHSKTEHNNIMSNASLKPDCFHFSLENRYVIMRSEFIFFLFCLNSPVNSYCKKINEFEIWIDGIYELWIFTQVLQFWLVIRIIKSVLEWCLDYVSQIFNNILLILFFKTISCSMALTWYFLPGPAWIFRIIFK